MPKIKLSAAREQFPMYGELSDEQFLGALRKKFYPEVPAQQFFNSIEYDTKKVDPTEDTGFLENAAAGAGKSVMDLWRTGKRLANKVGVGDYDQAAAAEDERLDKPLMDTWGGRAGKAVGDIALTAVPGTRLSNFVSNSMRGATMLPRTMSALAPYAGAATAGAATGAALSPQDMAEGALIGGVAGPVGEVAGRVVTGLYGAGKAAIEPLYEAGRERILRRTLERFAQDPAAVRQAAAGGGRQIVPGYRPTLAEATMDPGIAQLQRSAQTMPGVASEMAGARTQRLNAYRNALGDLAGRGGAREFHEAAREATADELYGRAWAEGFPGMTPELEQTFARLMQRPSIRAAMNEARELAAERGIDLEAEGSVAGLHWIKKALDDQISAAATQGRGTLANSLRNTQDELVEALRQASPAYGRAMAEYEAMSRPINQMAVGQRLHDTMFPAINDASEDAFRANASTYTKALRNGDATASAATGLRGATMEGTLDPQQLATVRGIGEDVTRSMRAQDLGAIPGSQTAQHLGARNILRGLLGPLGLPEGALDTMAGRIASGVLSLPFAMTQSQTEQLLAQALRNPQVAARLLNAPDNPTLIARLLQPYAAQIAIQSATE